MLMIDELKGDTVMISLKIIPEFATGNRQKYP
jgi:hypothetical protein